MYEGNTNINNSNYFFFFRFLAPTKTIIKFSLLVVRTVSLCCVASCCVTGTGVAQLV
jgi:hypothetical protein